MDTVRTLFNHIGEYKKASLLAPFFTALEVVMEVLMPFIMALIIDRGIQVGDMNAVYFFGFLMVVAAMLSLLSGVLAGRFCAIAATGFGANLRLALFEKVQTFSFSNIDKFSTGGLVTRMTVDITNLQNAYMMLIRIAVRAPLMIIISMVMCFYLSVRLSMVFLVAILVLALALSLIIGRVSGLFREVFNKYDELNASTQENITAIRVVKSFVRESYERAKFNKAATNLYKLFVKAEGLLALNSPVMMFVIFGCIIALSWFGAQFIVIGELTTGALTSFFTYVMSITMSLMMLSMVFVMISMSVASADRIAEVLNEEPTIAEPEEPLTEVPDGSIDFNHVCFRYREDANEDTLYNINLHIRSGETIGIIGATGSGKSTLVSLISRLYDVNTGEIRVGGNNVRDYDTEVLRDQVAVVLQNSVLFSGTILENLRWGNPEASEEECRKACEMACAHEFIERFPQGYETWIEQGGSNVSGGQRQRLCIARALLKKPKVLILDDSTSAVDTTTDAHIRKALRNAIPETTKIIIAQRVASVADADRIIVLHNGRMQGFDTHENLLKTNDIYREIYEVQTRDNVADFDQPLPGGSFEEPLPTTTEGGERLESTH
ncbi:MAG: ABC transporter ATP-binding protein [Eggerthellaceae bacterium]|jgi:ATP-binding cassette subfamily B multidrug efflux pump